MAKDRSDYRVSSSNFILVDGVMRSFVPRIVMDAVAYKECFSFSLFWTSSNVPLNGPDVSILIETSAAANFRDSLTSWFSLQERYAEKVVSPRPVLPTMLLFENLS